MKPRLAVAWIGLFWLMLASALCISSAAADKPAEASAPAVTAGRSRSSPIDEEHVKRVLRTYKEAIERLDASGTEALFALDAQIFESGGSEGSYQQYLAHHLGPELAEFASFKFDRYTAQVRFQDSVALATETYTYKIVLKKGGEPIERIGVATSVLKQEHGRWRIIQLHSSSRKPKPASQ